MPEYIPRPNNQLMMALIDAARRKAQKTPVADTISAVANIVNAHYKAKEERLAKQAAELAHQKELEVAYGEKMDRQKQEKTKMLMDFYKNFETQGQKIPGVAGLRGVPGGGVQPAAKSIGAEEQVVLPGWESVPPGLRNIGVTGNVMRLRERQYKPETPISIGTASQVKKLRPDMTDEQIMSLPERSGLALLSETGREKRAELTSAVNNARLTVAKAKADADKSTAELKLLFEQSQAINWSDPNSEPEQKAKIMGLLAKLDALNTPMTEYRKAIEAAQKEGIQIEGDETSWWETIKAYTKSIRDKINAASKSPTKAPVKAAVPPKLPGLD